MKISAQVNHLIKLGVNAFLCSICADNEKISIQKHMKIIKISGSEKSIGIIQITKQDFLANQAIKRIILSLGEKDIIYLRIRRPSWHFSHILKQPRDCKIVIEYQSIEPEEYRLKKKYWYIPLDFLFGNDIRKYTDAIVGITDEITRYQVMRSGDASKPHITIGNGFDVTSVPVRRAPSYTGDGLHLLCVAIVHRGHGLDRLIRGLASYKNVLRVVLHIAGDGPEMSSLKELTNNLGIVDQVVFHGFLTGKTLDSLFDQCHIAVGSLGIHRIGLREASILKAREYCARGIPFLYDVPDADFPSGFPYILRLPADESTINLEQVTSFVEEICADPNHPQKMRVYAEKHLDWSVKMKKLKIFLEATIDEMHQII